MQSSSGELDEPVEVLGHPRARLHLRAGSDGNVIVRLCDVAPDGSSTLVTRGCLNLARRAGMDRSAPALEAAETVEVAMSAIAWVFPPGHRMRLSVSEPFSWPRTQITNCDWGAAKAPGGHSMNLAKLKRNAAFTS